MSRPHWRTTTEELMWEALKNALIGVKDAVGLEIPGLPLGDILPK